MQTNHPITEQKNHQLPHPGKKGLIFGLIYYPVHSLFISGLVILLFMTIFLTFGDFPDGVLPFNLLVYPVAVGILIQTLVYLGIARRILKVDSFVFKTNLGKNIKIIAIAAVAGQILAIPYGLLMEHLGLIEGLGANNQMAHDLLLANIPVMLIVMWVLAPIWEEILMRGMIFAPLRKRSRILAYAVSALAFGLLHTWSFMRESGITTELLITTTLYFFPAISFSWAYEKTGSLWGAIATHTVSNIIGVAWLVFGL